MGWLTDGRVLDGIAYLPGYLVLRQITSGCYRMVIQSRAMLDEIERLAIDAPVAAAFK